VINQGGSELTETKKLTKPQMAKIVKEAEEAACKAYEAAAPTPMTVGTPKDVMGSLMGGDGGGLDPSKPTYYVSEGVCGFAWVKIYPATTRFVRYLRSKGVGKTGYGGGWEIWYSELGTPAGQSYERNMAAATAYAKVLQEAGFEAYPGGRLD
jgi:hypothetical protein